MSDELTAEELAIVSGKELEQSQVVETQADPVETPEKSQPEGERTRDDKGQFTKKDDEPTKTDAKPEKEDKHVPLATLVETRKEFQQKLADADNARKAERAEYERKFELLAARLPQPEVAKVATIEEDPLGALKRVDQRQTEFEQQRQQDEQRTQFARHVSAQAEQFRSQTPDYPDAYRFMQESMVRELRAMGRSDAEIPNLMAQAEFNIAASSLQAGKNPGQGMYEMAQARGYAKAAAAVDNAASVVDASKQLETIERGQNAAKSLGSVGGAAPAGKLSLDAVMAMSDDEITKLKPDELRRIFG